VPGTSRTTFPSVTRSAPRPITSGDSDEERLVQRSQKRERSAFETLSARYRDELRHFVSKRVCSSAVDDVLQEVWIAAWVSIPSFNRRSRFKAWLYGIAVRKCADYFRSAGPPHVTLDEALQIASAAQREGDDLCGSVADVIASLPESQREVIELYYHAELTLAEVATALDRNLNTVKYQFYRAHVQAADKLKAAQERDRAALVN
jgi:RNA polymerase sigma-70 factor (ECF subfamily)